ncbi:MAG TPA: YaaA family protein [Epsilonproteobacteria bacterium]|nr:YaaA family protein [Campylobacterota bacterium]
MKILLAPSETKKSGGQYTFDPSTLLFDTLMPHRMKLLHTYINILQQGDMQVLSKMFGIKKEADILKHKKDIIHELTMKAIERYTGVAFDYLNYETLSSEAQHYVDDNVILFSNLFGPIKASDLIPEYKLKQGESVGDIKTEKFYNEHSAHLMEDYLKEEEILDLRAGFYDKFYKPAKPYTTLKFIKDGKVVSHWAKAYRGIVLREIAKAGISSIEAFMKLPTKGLSIHEIQTKKNKTEIIYNIDN